MKLALLVLASLLAMPRSVRADACADLLTAPTLDPDLEHRCLRPHAHFVGQLAVGVGISTIASAFEYYGSLEFPAGPLRFEVRGRMGMGAVHGEALVGYRLRYHYGPGTVGWTTSKYLGSSAAYDYYQVTSHSDASVVRDELLIVGGIRGLYIADTPNMPSSLDLGKTFELGVQTRSASGYGTHRRLEALGVLRGTQPGAVLVWDNSIPPVPRLVEGMELGYVPYESGSPAKDQYEFYVLIQLGWAIEL